MFCPECGAQASDDQKYCKKCGTGLAAGTKQTLGDPHGDSGNAASAAQSSYAQPPPLPPRAQVAAGSPNVYAACGLRLLAFIIDYVFVSICVGVLVGVLGRKGNLFGQILLGAWVYKAGMECSPKQATIGKLLLGLKVTTLTGERISFLRASGRYFAQALDVVTLYVGYLMAAFTKKRQALHDMVAGTLVVYRRYSAAEVAAAPDAPSDAAGAVVAIAIGGVVVTGILAAIAIPAYQDYTIRAKVNEGLNLASPYKVAVAEAVAQGQPLRDLTNESLRLPQTIQSKYVDSIRVESGTVEINYSSSLGGTFLGRTVSFIPGIDASGAIVWACGRQQLPSGVTSGMGDRVREHTTVPDKYLPSACRAT